MPTTSSPIAGSHRAETPRIVFWGTPPFAVAILDALVRHGLAPILVVTQPDRTIGRAKTPSAPAVKRFALDHNLPVLQSARFDQNAIRERLRGERPDVFVVAAFGALLPAPLLAIPRHGAVNVHASLLPDLRGASPIQAAILEGRATTGVTIMEMDAELDHGPILAQEELPLRGTETTPELHDRLAKSGARLLVATLRRVLDRTIRGVRQDDRRATYAPLLKKEHGRLDWQSPAARIERMVRALNPWPGAWTRWHGKRLKLLSVRLLDRPGSVPSGVAAGQVFETAGGETAIACGEGAVVVLSLQLENRQAMPTDAFVRGAPRFLGATLDLPVTASRPTKPAGERLSATSP